MWFKAKEKEYNKKDNLKDLALKKIKKVKTQNKIRFDSQLIVEIVKIFRIYIKKRYALKKELTHEELLSILKQKKIKKSLKTKIVLLSLKICEIEYENFKLDKPSLEEIIKNLEEIILES